MAEMVHQEGTNGVTYPRRRPKVVGNGPPPAIFAVFVVFGSAVTLAMLGYVLMGPANQTFCKRDRNPARTEA